MDGEALAAEAGVAAVATYIVAPYARDGRLVPLLTGFVAEQAPISLVYPESRRLNPAVRAFLGFVAELMPPDPPWDAALLPRRPRGRRRLGGTLSGRAPPAMGAGAQDPSRGGANPWYSAARWLIRRQRRAAPTRSALAARRGGTPRGVARGFRRALRPARRGRCPHVAGEPQRPHPAPPHPRPQPRWWRDRPAENETWPHGAEKDDLHLKSPLYPVVDHGETVRRRLERPTPAGVPLLEAFRREGATDYLALPLPLGDGRRFSASWATDRPGGFRGAPST